MQDCERNNKKSRGEAAPPFSTLFTSFKPRQVILNSMSNIKLDHKNVAKSLISLTPEQRKLLLQSICQFLELNGFSKSLKKFHKEADVEKESWKSCLLNLEEMCYQFLKLRDDAKVSDCATIEKTTDQKDGSLNGVASLEKENGGDEGRVDDVGVKQKKKKKSKCASDSSAQIAEETHPKPSENPDDVSLSVPIKFEKKSKDKKKRKEESLEEKKEDKETLEKSDVTQEEKKEKSKNKKKKENTLIPNGSSVETTEVDKEKKSSKKRKKSSSDENETDFAEKAVLDDSKRRKIEDLDQSNGTILPKTPNGSANRVLEDGEKESHKKDKTRQLNGSVEPRTSANAFRRVKEEEVEFVDERLQDNSYWAKDGADSGYGAKAQEVLGQVRGRDFRHEKTKKKRGSYRGGHIDLQSHSVKFNYDDEE
ncbi:nucleolar and coiled-body phosphoprotein 1-like [Chenopodium quinoa]|uniref:nucleolar and coiled-body phosphoprotein 1-like n=1 Tax=Chenopodium quinoa TaxID=63459 RepID=UPI000B78D882|nr:nucleolar and coiled-body phosphoprotein 1-like [Chenopodium quinoa]